MYHSIIKKILKSKRGGVFDEAMLLGAKGLLLILIVTALSVTILSIIDNFSNYLETLSSNDP